MVAHGFALSIGSATGWCERHLEILDDCFDRLDVAWHSEHLGFTDVDGEDLRTMVSVPRTPEALDLVAGRVTALRERYGVPFLLENIADLLPDPGGCWSEAGFLNVLADASGCGLLLDVYNLECNGHNHGLDVAGFLAELDMAHVRELHVAGGIVRDGAWLDVHSRPTPDSTIELARDVLRSAPAVEAVTYEVMAPAVPVLGHDGVADELGRLTAALAGVPCPS